MIGSESPARREGLLRRCRKLVAEDADGFVEAGQRLAEMYSSDYAQSFESTSSAQGRQLLFIRLDLARRAAIHGDPRVGMTDLLFEKPLTKEARKHAARMTVLALVLSIDPNANDYVDEHMCQLSALTWDCGELHGDSQDILGRSSLSWGTQDHNDVDSPPASVLDLLERALWSARTGDVWEPWLHIQGGDGMPIDEQGTNAYDELWRSMLDVLRYIDVFETQAVKWAEIHCYSNDESFGVEREHILAYTRSWWNNWQRVVRRAHNASLQVTRPELMDDVKAGRKALNQLAQIFVSPTLGSRIEKSGDHLFRRGPLKCDKHGVTEYPFESVNDALGPIKSLTRELWLYIDGSIPLQSPSTSSDERVFRLASWFSKATNEALYPDLLKRAVRDGRLQNSEKRSTSRWMHDVDEVAGEYPQYAEVLRKALEADSLG